MPNWSSNAPGLTSLIQLTQLLARARQVEVVRQLRVAEQQLSHMPKAGVPHEVTKALAQLRDGVKHHPSVTAMRQKAPVLKHLTVSSTRRSRF